MQRINFSGVTNSHATITGELMAIFSRQPVKVIIYADEIGGTECRLSVSSFSSDVSFSEERVAVRETSNTYGCEFEISRMLQLVFPTDEILKRVRYDGTPVSLGDLARLTIDVKIAGAWHTYGTASVSLLHASCDWGESINSARVSRRLWANYPMTITAGKDEGEDDIPFTGEDEHFLTPSESYALTDSAFEVDPLRALEESGDALADSIKAGIASEVVVGYNGIIANGQGSNIYAEKVYALAPSLRDFGRGVYLRWLTRFGGVGYWLFDKSKKSVTASVAQSFERTPEGIPAMAQNGVIDNPTRQSFSVSEQMTIVAPEITDSEYNYLLGLAQSPCVEMLVGGTRNAPEWVRVTIAPATYTLDIPRSELPRVRDFELQIILPQRNTARL